jgi:SAM-dependent methyltransferase
MDSIEARVADHYSTGAILERIADALRALGQDPDHPDPDALKPVDEFHTGGFEATEALLDQIDIDAETRILDIGAGIGGTARFLVRRHGCPVVTIDLTQAFVDVATTLNARLGLTDAIASHAGSALNLPVADGSIDLATMFHVGMNLRDKAALFRDVARALAPGGRFALYDVMAGENDEALQFPLPWSSVAETSFVDKPDIYRRAADAAGLTLVAERNRLDFALSYFHRVFKYIEEHGMPPMGIHLLMDDPGTKLGNYVANAEAGRIAPVEMIFQKAR